MNDETKNEMEKSTEIKSIDENYENLKAVITALTNDYEKFKQKKVKAAGQRVRASLLNTKKLCDTLRKQVKEDMTAIPIKHRAKSPDKSSSDDEQKVGETITTITKEDDGVYETSITLLAVKDLEEKPKRKRKANKPKEN
jgi:hypothetical protein